MSLGIEPTSHGEGAVVSVEQLEEMGPVDYVIIEWPRGGVGGDVVPLLLDLVDREVIRLLDVAFIAKDDDGSMTVVDSPDLGPEAEAFAELAGASSGLVDEGDLEEAAAALEPGTAAAVLLWENRWAAPLAVAIRRSGGQLVASGRIPVQAIVASLDALEATR
jgi:uncharacterized protein DUF6325